MTGRCSSAIAVFVQQSGPIFNRTFHRSELVEDEGGQIRIAEAFQAVLATPDVRDNDRCHRQPFEVPAAVCSINALVFSAERGVATLGIVERSALPIGEVDSDISQNRSARSRGTIGNSVLYHSLFGLATPKEIRAPGQDGD